MARYIPTSLALLSVIALFAGLASTPASAQDEKERAWCVNKETRLSTTPVAQMKNTYQNSACLLNAGPNPGLFLQMNYGGPNKRCTC